MGSDSLTRPSCCGTSEELFNYTRKLAGWPGSTWMDDGKPHYSIVRDEAAICRAASAQVRTRQPKLTQHTNTSQHDQWQTFLSATASTFVGKPAMRWLHIPKCGSSFFHTYSLYACNIEWHRQSHLVGPSYVGDNKSAGGSIY